MHKQLVQLEWRYWADDEVDEQTWAAALSPSMNITLDTRQAGYWRSGRGRQDGKVLALLVALLLWARPWLSADVRAATARLLGAATIPLSAMMSIENAPAEPQITILPSWRPMQNGLQHYFQLRRQQDDIWRYIARRPALWQQASTLPLYALLPDDLNYRTQIYHWSPADQNDLTLMLAGTVAEYVFTIYGQARLYAFLQGFSRYASWEELSPAVFGVPAIELEAGWHAYLAEHAEHLLAAGRSQTYCISH